MIGGVGYLVYVTKRTIEQMPPDGHEVRLDIHTHVREDAIQLFGFLHPREREVFETIIGMSGMGPRAAMSVLSGIDPAEFARAVCSEDIARLCRVPGIGKKKAERMCLELRDKLMLLAQETAPQATTGCEEDLRSALVNLGFKPTQVEQALGSMKKQLSQQSSLETLLPQALKLLRG